MSPVSDSEAFETQEVVGGRRKLVNSLDYLDIYDARLSAKHIAPHPNTQQTHVPARAATS
jgi:hypothetical protein